MSAAVLIAARSLCAGYSGVPVVRDVDIELCAGSLTVLLGPNGAGKTTVLLALAGELPPTAGCVEMNGAPVTTALWSRARHGLCYISADHAIIRSLSVWDNLRLTGSDPGPALEAFPEIADHRRRKAGLLSGGQQRMLSLAMALGSDPKILIADEMSLGLAPLIVHRLLRAVRAAADRGVAVLLVEQHARQALAMADYALVLSKGAVVRRGTAADLLADWDDISSTYVSGSAGSAASADKRPAPRSPTGRARYQPRSQ